MSQSVVTLHEIEEGIVQLTMADHHKKNTFSESLVTGLHQAFQQISENKRYKVVVMTGYDSYFCSGGTQQTLLNLSDGEGTFIESGVYSLALDCRIPVISAMQGHGIGGGFVFGLFADFVILSRESVYTTNFMKYGFTPGFGATCILKEKLGLALAQEMLITAASYRGEELRQRGVTFPVYPREEVLTQAYRLARLIAEKPRLSLITLKDHMVSEIREKLPKIALQEVAMHDKTFHQPEVKTRIEALFGQ